MMINARNNDIEMREDEVVVETERFDIPGSPAKEPEGDCPCVTDRHTIRQEVENC